MTDGMKTSEFWGKVLVQFIGLLALLGVVKPTQLPAAEAWVQPVAGLLAVVIPEVFYAISRGIAKLNSPRT